MKRFFSAVIFMCLTAGLAANAGASPRFVGVEGCKCHKMEISDWESSKHGQAFQLLEAGKRRAKKKKASLDPEKDYTADTKCLKCHTTGYKQEGGFVDNATTPNLAGIGCEMCHGPGSEYREIHKKKTTTFTVAEAKAAGQLFGSIDEEVCRRCHEHKDTPFQPKISEKYKFNLKEALKDSEAFHKLYPLEGKHE
jgi:cytochrome c554/c'-like protein